MNNLMIESIERIYRDGSLDIYYDRKKICLSINKDNKLVADYYECLDLEIEPIKVENEKNIAAYLALLATYSIWQCDKKIELQSTKQEINSNVKLEIINQIYDIYESMLDVDSDIYKQILFGRSSDGYYIFANIAKYGDTTHQYDITYITSALQLLTDRFLSNYHELFILYQKFINSRTLEESEKNWNNFNQFSQKDTKAKQATSMESQMIDTAILQKCRIAYEMLNERNYVINPAMGREKEIREIGATLLTPSYSPILIGYSGVGKTAVVEGLSYAIKNQQVPQKLMDKQIVKITPSAIINGCNLVGMFEQKMEVLINFFKNNPNLILYMDELHTALGAGTGGNSSNDILNILKPHLENGSIKMIGATTIEEYDTILKKDAAFTRRFKIINISEPKKNTLKNIILSSIEKFEQTTNISFACSNDIKEEMIDLLIDVTKESNRQYTEKRYNPALVLSIIESAFGYASYDGEDIVGTKYLSEAISQCENIYPSIREDKSKRLSLLNRKSTIRKKNYIIEFKKN